mmetsp:Transcript_20176/g.51504  ORF Transcript_20176/g.51504 Transcript_20176/m.51504 type:complete len:205 (-) Transcript_20176:1330-1944(-)
MASFFAGADPEEEESQGWAWTCFVEGVGKCEDDPYRETGGEEVHVNRLCWKGEADLLLCEQREKERKEAQKGVQVSSVPRTSERSSVTSPGWKMVRSPCSVAAHHLKNKGIPYPHSGKQEEGKRGKGQEEEKEPPSVLSPSLWDGLSGPSFSFSPSFLSFSLHTLLIVSLFSQSEGASSGGRQEGALVIRKGGRGLFFVGKAMA